MCGFGVDHTCYHARYSRSDHVTILDVHAAVMPVPPADTTALAVGAFMRIRFRDDARPDTTAHRAMTNLLVWAQAFLFLMRTR